MGGLVPVSLTATEDRPGALIGGGLRPPPRYSQPVDEVTISISTCEETRVLVASWNDPRGFGGITTQAERLGDLERNIREAVAVHFEPGGLPTHLRIHFLDDRFLTPMSFGCWNGRISRSLAREGRTSVVARMRRSRSGADSHP